MSFNTASPYRIENRYTGNLIAQSADWPHQNGLFCYGGDGRSDDQIWYFLSIGSNGFRITNFLYPGWLITENPEDNIFVQLGGNQVNQHWKVNAIRRDNAYYNITNHQTGDALLDQTASRTNGNLSAMPVGPDDHRAQWRLVAGLT